MVFTTLPSILTLRAIASAFGLGTATGSGPEVETTFGPISGIGTGEFHAFKGIPFAQSPPVRFAAPADPKPWSSVLDTTAFKPACIQQINEPAAAQNFVNSIFNNPAPVESEDCLYLNVWKPTLTPPEGGFPVLFWIYGGDLEFGSGGFPMYDGTVLATKGFVVVTHNYRTNVFGFPNSPDLPKNEGNPGFLDQRKALEWVRANIAKFSGDPTKVTIFGQSAGGYSVKQLIANPPSPLNFRAAFMLSQASSPKDGPASWGKLTQAVNCTDASQQLDCMRKVDALTLKKTMEHLALGFNPVDDGVTASTSIESNIKSGKAAKVPVIIGSTAADGSAFSLAFSFTAATDPKAPLTAPDKATTASINMLEFQCPAALISDLLVDNGYPGVYRYYFNASVPQFAPFPEAGAFHGIELQPLFGNFKEGQASAWTDVAGVMQGALLGFATDPTSGPGWDAQTKDVKPVGVFNIDGLVIRPAADLDKGCDSYTAVIESTGV